MDWGALFFSFSGRINRAKYWLASLLLILAFLLPVAVAYVITLVAVDPDGVALLAIVTVFIIFFIGVVVSGLAIAAKRLHDRDKSAWWLLLFYLVPGLLGGLGDATGDIGAIFHVIGFGISIWALIELGFLRGTAGANRFGPDPLGTAVPQAG
jgi:uncharacterized membrane protein YhaH (DUF805 family)